MRDPRELIGGANPIGQRWAIELIAAVLPASAARLIRPHHIAPLESLLYRSLSLHGEGHERFTRRVRVAYRILEDGFDRDPGNVGQIFGATLSRLGDLQQTEHNLHSDAWNADKGDPDRRFRSLLDLYRMTYERYYRTLAAPFVVAGAIVERAPDPTSAVDGDGRVKLKVIGDLERGRAIVDGALTGGLDNHLRNSAAHAIILFDISHGRKMYERGWLHPDMRARRNDVLRSELGANASLHGFSVEGVSQANRALTLELTVLGEAIPNQNSAILTGGPGGYRRYTQEIRTYHAPAWKQVYGFLQMSYDLHGYYDVVEVRLRGRENEDLGRLQADRSVREAMITSDEEPESLRARMELDTLSDTEIPVVLKGPPAPGR